MKKLLLLLFVLTLSYGQTRTSIFRFPQWNSGDTLKAGTASDSAQSNFSLNNGFARADDILGRQINSEGLFSTLYGVGGINLNLLADQAHTYRIVMLDSVYGYYNWQTEGNLLVQGNARIGGYLTVDSVVTGADFTIQNDLSVFGNITDYGSEGITSLYGLSTGIAGTRNGSVHFESAGSSGEPSGMSLITVDDDFNDTLYLPHLTGANRIDTIVTRNGKWIFPDVAGTVALSDANQALTDMAQIVADSVAVTNNYEILYSDTKIAGASAGDTSANFTTFLNTTNANETKVRFTYLHRRGTQNISAYYQIKGAVTTSVGTKINIYTVGGVLVSTSSNTSTANATFEDDSNTLSVANLSSNTLYEVRIIGYGTVPADDIPVIQRLTVVATSN